jgi:hypothetical protein
LILIVEVARFSGVFEVYYDAEPYSTKDRPGILSVLLREYDWASSTMDPSGVSIVKISARNVNPSIPDVEWFNCGHRVATIHHDRKLAAPNKWMVRGHCVVVTFREI